MISHVTAKSVILDDTTKGVVSDNTVRGVIPNNITHDEISQTVATGDVLPDTIVRGVISDDITGDGTSDDTARDVLSDNMTRVLAGTNVPYSRNTDVVGERLSQGTCVMARGRLGELRMKSDALRVLPVNPKLTFDTGRCTSFSLPKQRTIKTLHFNLLLL